MADVLIVCVREDEPQAKALAEMFEAAGFSIGGAPSNDAGLRSSGAGVVVWSQASIRSRPFLDAAQRVINANKAVVASLIEPPPPSSIGDSPAFDLSRWDGDPNDPALDPLFFAVDRMVNSARAAVTGGLAAAEFDEPPPAPRAPPPPPFRESQPNYREPPQTYREPPRADPLDAEAEHWRAIRDSRDPSDFMDYLSRYGPQGTFAEVAELRLKQLSGAAERPAAPRQPARPVTPRAAPSSPAAREPAPPAPRRSAEPPPRRADPPPAARRADAPTRRGEPPTGAPQRRPPPERGFDRTDLREPTRNEGGALRAIILVALLGGAALIGGLYFGGGMDFATRPAAQGEDIEVASPPPVGEEAAAYDEPADASSVPLSQAVREQPAERRAGPVERQPPRQQQAAAQTPPRSQAPTQRAAAQPSQSNPATPSAGTQSSGPVSLTPGSVTAGPGGQSTSASTPGSEVPLRPLPAAPAPTQAATPRTTPPAGDVVWVARPSERRIAELYPQRALREGSGGRAVLDCTVLSNLNLSCVVSSETPTGEGFGRAALSASRAYRVRATLSNGQSSIGANARITINFQAPQR